MALALELLLFAVVAFAGPSPAADAPKTRIYIANDDHTDYMWTADAATYDRVFVEMLDFHLRLIDETAGNPSPFQSRFNADGTFWLWSYERRRSPAEFERLIGRIRSGHVSVPLNALVSCYGGQPAEAVLRGMYYAGRLERRHGLRFSQAVAMENQTLPLGLASLWAGAGAKYSWRGVCACASRVPAAPLAARDHEIYWSTGLDGQRVLMKWHSAGAEGNRQIGGYAEAFDPVAAIRFLDGDREFLQRYRAPGSAEPYRVRAAFGFGWDALDRKTGEPYPADPGPYPPVDHFHRVAQRETTSDRQVIVSNQEDFFRDFAATHGADLPAETVTYGNEWDLYSASMAATSSRVRRAVERLRSAEALAALVALREPGFLEGRAAARDRAFMNLGLYWEHDWTADGPVPRSARAAWQEELAAGIEGYVDSLHADGAAALSSLVARSGSRPRFYALNPLGWTRTDAADFRYEGPEDVHVHDLAGASDVPHQLVTHDGERFLRVLARDIPPVGYKVFEVRPGPGGAPRDPAASFAGSALENARVRLALERDGAIRSLVDKRDPGVDLAATIDGLAVNDLAAGEAGGAALVVESAGPVSVTVRATSDAGRRHTTRVTLYRDSSRVDLANEITENFGEVRHWAFSFDLVSPDVRTEETGAIVRVKKKEDGGHYADRNARYDYATLNHFADIADGANARGVTLSNRDCSFVKLGRSTPTELDTATAQLGVLAGGQVDGEGLGIRAQNGATSFLQRFSLRPHRGYDAVAAMKFALEHQNPPVTGPVSGAGGAAYPEASYSLLTVDDPGVLLWALKPAEEGIGQGLIVRLWNLSGRAVETHIRLAGGSETARRATHVETDLDPVAVREDGSIDARSAPHQIQTYRVTPALPGPSPVRDDRLAVPRRMIRP